MNAAKIWRAPVAGSDDLELLRAAHWSRAFPAHAHETYSIPLIEAGAMASRYRGAEHVLGLGDFDIINPGEPHTGRPFEVHGWSYRCFYPSVLLLEQIATECIGRPQYAPVFRKTDHDPQLFRCLLHLHHLLNTGADLESDTELRETFALLIARHGDGSHHAANPGREPRAMATVRACLEDRYAETIRLETLARIANLSPIYLVRAFRQTFGLPPHAYQRQIRVNRARRFLAAGHSIADVAARTGFADQSHLTRHFKSVVGVTPGAYQRGS